jgi:replicative DNA helicase
MPHVESFDDECAVLGAVLAEPPCFWEAATILSEADFLDPRNKIIFGSILALAEGGLPYDAVSVRKYLRETGKIKEVSEAHLSSLDDSLPDVANVPYYAQRVKDEHTRVEAIKMINSLKADLVTGRNVQECLDKHQSELLGLYAGLSSSNVAVHISEPVAEAMNRLERLKAGDHAAFGVRSGVSLIDDKFAFLAPKNVYVVCGGVSAGKSALADQIADYVAARGQNVFISCLEMSALQRAERFISRRARCTLRAWQAQEHLSADAERRLMEAATQFKSPPIYIDDSRGVTTMDILARAKRFKDLHGLGLLVIDYLQLIKPIRRAQREVEVAEISGAVNEMAGHLNVPVLLVSQLSRTHQAESREPEMRDLRESGRIEQDAFGIVAVYRPDIELSLCKMIILKNRQGPLGRKDMNFIGEQVRFEDLGPGQYYKEEEVYGY